MTLIRPWLKADAEGAGRFVLGVLKTKPQKARQDDPELAGWAARCAFHWARLALGEAL